MYQTGMSVATKIGAGIVQFGKVYLVICWHKLVQFCSGLQ